MQEENSEKMVLISSVCNQWTLENNQNMASVAAAPPPARADAAMDQKAAVAAFSPGFIQQQQSNQHSKQQQQQQQQEQNNGNGQQQEALRCPRCDSSNTKFCYYNNYSLSQPRHFCKACKRYWTRGGTLRSVPVGGGCRKNKRVRRHPNNNNNNTSTTNNTFSNNNINLREGSVNSLPVVSSGHPIHDLMISSPTNNNPLYYGSNNHNLMNFPFSRYDLQIPTPPPPPPQMNGFGLGFSSSGLVHNINGDEVNFRNLHNNNNNNNSNNNNNNNNKQIFQDLISTTTTPPTISSFLASTFQMKGGGGGNNNFETILPSYDEGSDGIYTKEEVVKTEVEGQNGSSLDHDPQEWCGSSRNGQMDHQQQQMGGSSPSCDPSLIWGSGPNLGAWLDPSTNNNLSSSSSLTSLI